MLVLSIVAAATLLAPVRGDPTEHFAERKGRLIAAERQAQSALPWGVLTQWRLRSDSGLVVELEIVVPHGPERPRPTLLVLGGHETGRRAARLVDAAEVACVAAISYPHDVPRDRRGLGAVLNIPHYQRGILDTVPALSLAADFLVQQPCVDARRLELVGVSLGAFFAGAAGASDPRFGRVWFVHGAGRPRVVIEHVLRDEIASPTLRRMAAAALNTLAAGEQLANERWVARISPRPVIAINARDEDYLPRDAVTALHESLAPPYEILWTQGGHVQPDEAEVLEQLRTQMLSRLERN